MNSEGSRHDIYTIINVTTSLVFLEQSKNKVCGDKVSITCKYPIQKTCKISQKDALFLTMFNIQETSKRQWVFDI